MSKTKALIYCRVSSKAQLKGDGLNSQEYRCRKYAEEKGYSVEAVFPDSMTGKGDFMTRPGMVTLLSFLDAQAGANYVVIFDDLKRFARDTEFHLNLRRVLNERGASVECLNFKFEDTPEGKFIETIIAAQGELDREQNARQTRQKSEARLRQGYWVFQAPKGYKYTLSDTGGKVLIRDEPIASIIAEGLSGYAAGRFASTTELGRFFESHPAYPKCTPSGGVRKQRVFEVLKNPIYAGRIDAKCWDIKTEGKHEPLISLETFYRNQERMEDRGYAMTRKDTNEDFPLRGAVSCSSCNTSLTGGWAKGRKKHYAYYWCPNAACDLKGKTIPKDKIEGEFTTLLETLTPSKLITSVLRDMLKLRWDERSKDLEGRRRLLEQQSRKSEKEMDQLIQRAVQSTNARVAAAYEGQIEKLQQRLDVLAEKAANIAAPLMGFSDLFEHSLKVLSNPKKLWNCGNLAFRRLVLCLTFADHLQNAKGTGFEPPAYSGPFNRIKT